MIDMLFREEKEMTKEEFEVDMLDRKIIKLNIGRPNLFLWKGTTLNSAIGKKQVNEAMLTKSGFIGDSVANRTYHGGPDRAVCLYPFEHYEIWEREFNRSLKYPAFGENISVKDMLEQDVFIGDTFSLGEAVVQISQGRIPCATISSHNQVDKLLARVIETGYTGYFFRVLEEGLVREDSCLTLIDRRQEKFTVLKGNHLMFHNRENREAIEEIVQVKELADVWRDKFLKVLKK